MRHNHARYASKPLDKANAELDGGAIVLKEIEAEAVLEDCRALISQINAELFAEEPFVNVSRAAELQLYLEFAASALKRAAIALNYRDGAGGPAPASPLPC